jgi:pyrroline-5-carboxylate reductase
MKITFIGGGNMASALIGGMLAGSHRAADVVVVDPDAGSRERLVQRFGVSVHARADATALAGDVVVLAVKPQQMPAVAKGIAPVLRGQLVISVAAGIRSADLSRWLAGHGRIVRTMPNTPALIGEGITALAGAPGLADADRDAADSIMRAVGQTLWVDDESMIDAVTAVSGSGPAYVFFFMEAMQAAARAMGFDEAQSRKLTQATFAGAARLAANSEDPPAVLRERVTSKGGTTAAALAVLAQRGVQAHIVEAIEAARRRSAELGEEFGRE